MNDCKSTTKGRLGRITLDRRNALNALTLEMVSDISAALAGFAADSAIERVLIDSAVPNVFCAGGDIKMVRGLAASGRHEQALAFFRTEFALNRMIAEFPKPYIALIDGICFGGGMGLSIHGRHRVITEQAAFAMPEVAIGYFPDVGASHFLSRLPAGVGLWLGLTGHRVKADAALAIGLATHRIAAGAVDGLRQALAEESSSVYEILGRFALQPGGGDRNEIGRMAASFRAESLQAVLSNLERSHDRMQQDCLDLLRASSAFSATLTFSLINHAKGLSLAECLARELRAADLAVRHPDFVEGVRALLIDKDRKPRWLRTVAEWATDHAAVAVDI
jgi:enoyl-CoA hydratase